MCWYCFTEVSVQRGGAETASEVWGMRPQNGDNQHGVTPLNITSATNRNGRLVNLSDHVGNITNISSLGLTDCVVVHLALHRGEKIAGFPGMKFFVQS
jgi:hypothetical protein